MKFKIGDLVTFKCDQLTISLIRPLPDKLFLHKSCNDMYFIFKITQINDEKIDVELQQMQKLQGTYSKKIYSYHHSNLRKLLTKPNYFN